MKSEFVIEAIRARVAAETERIIGEETINLHNRIRRRVADMAGQITMSVMAEFSVMEMESRVVVEFRNKGKDDEPRRDVNGDVIPWPKEADYFMGFDPDNPDIPTD